MESATVSLVSRFVDCGVLRGPVLVSGAAVGLGTVLQEAPSVPEEA